MSRGAVAPPAAHTPEPWRLSVYPTGKNYTRTGTGFDVSGASTFVAAVGPLGCDDLQLREANARRIVACVNSLAGVPDPEAAVRALVEAVSELVHAEWPPLAEGIEAPCHSGITTREKCPHCSRWDAVVRALSAFGAVPEAPK